MIGNSARLISVQDSIWLSKRYMPVPLNACDEITYCNLATLAVAQGMGCTLFDVIPGKEVPMTANQMYDTLAQQSVMLHGFVLRKPIQDCQLLVNTGALIFAALPSAALHQAHGHICTLTPGMEDYSGHWDKKTPLCMNLGSIATCFRARGVNWAFVVEPEFYAWVPTL